jgi:hypothetical protein
VFCGTVHDTRADTRSGPAGHLYDTRYNEKRRKNAGFRLVLVYEKRGDTQAAPFCVAVTLEQK